MRDEIAVGALVGSFAAWVTVHLVLALALTRQPPRWHGLVALVVPPLAPYGAWRRGRRGLAVTWLVLGITWGVARLFFAG